jgi:Na+-driven multidrug efflux pump
VIWREHFIRLFITDPEVVMAGAVGLKIISIGFISYGFGMVLVNALNGAGDTFSPTIINVFCYWILEIPLAWYLAIYSGLGEYGVYVSIVMAETAMTISALVVFRAGRWKRKIV